MKLWWRLPVHAARCFGLTPRTIGMPGLMFFSVALVVCAVSFAISWRDAGMYGGIDLRGQVVGARAMFDGIDPYQPPAQLPVTPRLLDPVAYYELGFSRCVHPPTLLVATGLHSWMPYRTQRYVVFLLSWTALLVSIALLARAVRPARPRLIFVLLALVFFGGGYFWRLHVERGQKYVYLTLLISIAVWLAVRAHRGGWLAGAAMGLVAAVRPTAWLMLLLLWVLRQGRMTAAAAITAVAFVAMTLPVGGMHLWQRYGEHMAMHEKFAVDLIPVRPVPINARPSGWEMVEGCNFGRVLPHNQYNFVVHNLFAVLHRDVSTWRRWLPPTRWRAATKWLAGACIVVFVVLLAPLWKRRVPVRYTLAFALMSMIIIDYFVPQRWQYVDVLFLPPLALLMPLMLRRPSLRWLFGMLLAGLVAGHGFADFVPPWWATLLRSVLVVAALSTCLVVVWLSQLRHPAGDSSRRMTVT